MQNYWTFHNSKMVELRKKYDKIDRQTRNRLQEIFNRFEITVDNLYSYVSKDVKKQVNAYIEEWVEKKIDDEYFKMLMMTVLTKNRVTYAEILELFIYEAYVEQQMKEKDEEDSLFYTLFAFYYMEGQKEVNNTLPKEKKKKYSTFYEDLFATIIMTPNSLGYIYVDYKKSITKYNAEQILRQATISITQGKELKIDSSEFQNLIDRQQKAKLNINGDKISGAVDNTLIGMNNQAKAMGITAIQPDALVKFIAVMDEKTTKMCESLDGQIFSVRDWNEFKRYSESHQGTVKYRCRGLVTGLNLPPINDNFHFCRSTIIYVGQSPAYYRKANYDENNSLKADLRIIYKSIDKLNNIRKDFDLLKTTDIDFRINNFNDGTQMRTRWNKKSKKYEMEFNENIFNEQGNKEYIESIIAGGIKNSTVDDIIYHEAGHIIIDKTLRKLYNNNDNLVNQNRLKFCQDVVKIAENQLNETDPMKILKLKNNISYYALENSEELICESLMDVYVNNENSNRLSALIVNELKKRSK